MPLLHYISFGALALLIIAQYTARPFLVRHGKKIYQAIFVIAICTVLYETHTDFVGIVNGGPGVQYYGPPYISVSFFLLSAWSRIIAPYTLSAFISLLALWGMTSPGRYQDRFEAGEPYLIASALLLLRHPFWILYAVATLLCYTLITISTTLRKGGQTRITFYYFWLPLAIAVLATAPLLINNEFLKAISFANLR